MKFESLSVPAEKEIKAPEKKFDERILDKLNPEMRRTAESLRSEGFPVDDYLQAETSAFEGMIKKEEIEQDEKKVSELEEKFLEDKFKEFSESGITPELLEIAVPVGFNKGWAGDRFVAIRASRYDDIFNGVDSFLIDRETGQAVAAIDITADIKHKINTPKVQERIISGCKVKYGFGFDKDGVFLQSLNKLPLILISLTKKQLEDGVKNFEILDEAITQTLKSQATSLKQIPQIKSPLNRDVDRGYKELSSKLI